MRFYRTALIAAALSVAALASSPAWADLYIDVNGNQVAYSAGDDSAACAVAGCGGYADWAITEISLQGYLLDTRPEVFAGGTINATFGAGAAALSFELAETSVPAGGVQSFGAVYTGAIFGDLTVTRTFYIDPNNGTNISGLTALASLSSTCVNSVCTNTCNGAACNSIIFHAQPGLGISFSADTGSNPKGYSIIEMMTLDPTGSGGSMTINDYLLIPEPATLGLLGTGLVALGAFRRRRKAAKKA